jgi:hypothetical protein
MRSKIATILTLLAITLAGPALVPSGAAYADCTDTASKQEVIDGIGQAGLGKCNDNGVDKIVNTIVNILSYVAGAAAIIMIIYSGFKYITSGGDSGKVSAAKNALIYAVIGIAVAVLAQLIVRFVITQATSATDGCSSGFHRRASDGNCIPDKP